MKSFIIILLLATGIARLQAQIDLNTQEGFVQDVTEQAANDLEDNNDIESEISDPEQYLQKPLNLNAASKQDLEKIEFLTDFQIASFLDYRKKFGQILSIQELNYIFGFNQTTVNRLNSLVYVGPKELDSINVQQIVKNVKQEILLRSFVKTKKTESYSGNPMALYIRYSLKTNNFRIGLLGEKDGGEVFARGVNPYGFDFYSGYASLQTKTFLKNITIGDYRLKVGQGILIWNGYSAGLSSGNISSNRHGQIISVNTSSSESGYLRGISTNIEAHGFAFTIAYSQKNMDANIDTIENSIGISSLMESGYHRTDNETEKKNSISESTYFGRLGFTSLHFNTGINYLNATYSLPYLKSEELYKIKNFNGNNFQGASIDYKVLLQNFQLFGEIASGNNKIAYINGVSFMPASSFTSTIYYRKYPPGYFSPYANSLGENTTITNEEGLFAGFLWQTDWKTEISAFADIFNIPWISYLSDVPSSGKCYFTDFVFTQNENFDFSIRYKYKSKDKNITSETQPMSIIGQYNRQNLRLLFHYQVLDNVRMATRAEWCESGFNNQQKSKGFLVCQDFNFQLSKTTSLNFRYAQYSIPDYDSRIYVYENDVRYAFSMPAFYGNGCKTVAMLRKSIGDKIILWFKYGFEKDFEDKTQNNQEFKTQLIIKI